MPQSAKPECGVGMAVPLKPVPHTRGKRMAPPSSRRGPCGGWRVSSGNVGCASATKAHATGAPTILLSCADSAAVGPKEAVDGGGAAEPASWPLTGLSMSTETNAIMNRRLPKESMA